MLDMSWAEHFIVLLLEEYRFPNKATVTAIIVLSLQKRNKASRGLKLPHLHTVYK